MGYEIIEHPADIGFRVRGASLEEAFEEAALALFSLMASGQCTEYAEARSIEVVAEDHNALLYEFLEELLILFETENFFGVEASVRITHGTEGASLSAAVIGTKINPKTWHALYDVKAVTYHQMRIEEEERGWVIEVILDI